MIREWKARLKKIEFAPKKILLTLKMKQNSREEKQFWQVQIRAQSKSKQMKIKDSCKESREGTKMQHHTQKQLPTKKEENLQ